MYLSLYQQQYKTFFLQNHDEGENELSRKYYPSASRNKFHNKKLKIV